MAAYQSSKLRGGSSDYYDYYDSYRPQLQVPAQRLGLQCCAVDHRFNQHSPRVPVVKADLSSPSGRDFVLEAVRPIHPTTHRDVSASQQNSGRWTQT